jgi:hypothetical protein
MATNKVACSAALIPAKKKTTAKKNNILSL